MSLVCITLYHVATLNRLETWRSYVNFSLYSVGILFHVQYKKLYYYYTASYTSQAKIAVAKQ